MKNIFFLDTAKLYKSSSFDEQHSYEFNIKYFYDSSLLIHKAITDGCEIVVTVFKTEKSNIYKKLKKNGLFVPVLQFNKKTDINSLITDVRRKLASTQLKEKNNIKHRLKILSEETNEGIMSEILEMFTTRCADYKGIAIQCILDNDFEQIKFLAHNLKSTSANIGALTMSKICEFVELESIDQQLIPIYVNNIFYEYQKTAALAQQILLERR